MRRGLRGVKMDATDEMDATDKMTGFLDTFASLADAPDRDALEYTMASVMFELTGARLVSVWSVAPRDGDIGVRCCVTLGSARCERCDVTSCALPGDNVKPLDSKPTLKTCYETKRHIRAPSRFCGLYRDVFPVVNGHGVVRLVEILRAEPMREDEERLVFGLLRIYRNHLGTNDYGDCDDLTGLLNRRAFEDTFRALISPKPGRGTSPFGPIRAGDESRGVHLAMIDIDFFKRVNDGFGHPHGDEALVLLARLMGENFRETDRLFRFGGEAFVAVLPDTDPEGAAVALERLRVLVENFDFPEVGRITVSIGYTSVRRDDTGATASARAEQALHAAKDQGRNRIRCFETPLASGAAAARG
jgi:diguanylate cyclase (GGDEF)-like protein